MNSAIYIKSIIVIIIDVVQLNVSHILQSTIHNTDYSAGYCIATEQCFEALKTVQLTYTKNGNTRQTKQRTCYSTTTGTNSTLTGSAQGGDACANMHAPNGN